MSWYFNDFAKLKSINPRQEGSGDDAEPAVGLDGEAELVGGGRPEPDAVHVGLHAVELAVRDLDLAHAREPLLHRSLDPVAAPEGVADLLLGGGAEGGAQLVGADGGLEVQVDGTAVLAFQISMTRPPTNSLATFHEHLKTEVPVHVVSPQQEMDLQPEGEEAEGAEA